MDTVRVGFVGTGPDPENASNDGYAMAYSHADAYEGIDGVELVGCADIVPANARAFADRYAIQESAVFEDYRAMLAELQPDLISVCTPPAVHADIVVGAARSGDVDAIHCEKPMAATWGESRLMAQEADRHDVALTFNHQRRFGDLFRRTKERLDRGDVGELRRVEYSWGNFFDIGSHGVDMINYFNDERSAEWVLANVDYREESIFFGVHNENQILAQWAYPNGVHAIAATGRGGGFIDAPWRVVGTEGEMAVRMGDNALHTRTYDGGEETEAFDDMDEWIPKALRDVVRAVRTGDESELCADNALNATELLFGAYESARRRGRVDFPLRIDDHPLEAMVESGDLDPRPADADGDG